MRGLLKAKKSLSLSLLADRQTKELFFFSSIKVERVERVEVWCGYTVVVVVAVAVLNYFNHAPPKNYVPFFRLIRWLEKARKQHTQT